MGCTIYVQHYNVTLVLLLLVSIVYLHVYINLRCLSFQIRSLDILEMLDNTEAPHSLGSSRQENYSASYSNRLPDRDIIDNLTVDPDISSMQCGESTSQKRRSPQRASQEEYHFCLKKPSLDTPSPPDELFKKHSLIP